MSGKTAKANRRITIAKVMLITTEGETINLDSRAIEIIDRQTKKPLFKVIEEEAKA